jgi:hypothetical protein
MPLADSTGALRRVGAAIAAAGVFMALAQASSEPVWDQAPPVPSPAEACTPGQIIDFCSHIPSDIPPGHGFLLDKGVFTTIDAPGASLTSVLDINDRGQMVGAYRDDQGITHGFLLDDGVFTPIDAPDAASESVLFDINNRGQMMGTYVDAGGTNVIFLCQPRASAPRSRPQALSPRP